MEALIRALLPDIQTFWTAIGAIGSILAVLATLITVIAAIFLYYKERKDRGDNILTSLITEILANFQALDTARMTEVNLTMSAYNNFTENINLFEIAKDSNLYLTLDILYKNFTYYNYLWQNGYQFHFMYEARARIYLYLVKLFDSVENIDQQIQMLSEKIMQNNPESDKQKVANDFADEIKLTYKLKDKIIFVNLKKVIYKFSK